MKNRLPNGNLDRQLQDRGPGQGVALAACWTQVSPVPVRAPPSNPPARSVLQMGKLRRGVAGSGSSPRVRPLSVPPPDVVWRVRRAVPPSEHGKLQAQA